MQVQMCCHFSPIRVAPASCFCAVSVSQVATLLLMVARCCKHDVPHTCNAI